MKGQEVYWRWKCVHKEERDKRKKERKVIFYPWEQSESARSTLTFCYIFAFDQVDVFLQISFIWNNRPFQEFRSEAVGNTPYHLSSFLIILGIWKNDKTAHLRCIRGCGASGTTGKRHHSMVCGVGSQGTDGQCGTSAGIIELRLTTPTTAIITKNVVLMRTCS